MLMVWSSLLSKNIFYVVMIPLPDECFLCMRVESGRPPSAESLVYMPNSVLHLL